MKFDEPDGPNNNKTTSMVYNKLPIAEMIFLMER